MINHVLYHISKSKGMCMYTVGQKKRLTFKLGIGYYKFIDCYCLVQINSTNVETRVPMTFRSKFTIMTPDQSDSTFYGVQGYFTNMASESVVDQTLQTGP